MAPQGIPMSDIDTIPAPDPPAVTPNAPAYRIPLPGPVVSEGLGPEVRLALEDELEWFSLPGGRVLYEAGDPADGLYLVLSGCLGVVRGPAGHAELFAEVVAGETVGDLALLAQRPQPATVIALRDTSLVRLNKGAFEALARRHPSILLPLALRVVGRLERALASRPFTPTVPKTRAPIPLEPDVPAEALVDALADALMAGGMRVKVLHASPHEQIEGMFYAIEIAHHLVLYPAAARRSPLTHMC